MAGAIGGLWSGSLESPNPNEPQIRLTNRYASLRLNCDELARYGLPKPKQRSENAPRALGVCTDRRYRYSSFADTYFLHAIERAAVDLVLRGKPLFDDSWRRSDWLRQVSGLSKWKILHLRTQVSS